MTEKLSPIARRHLESLRNQTLEQFSLDKVPQWVEKYTTINLRPFSFKHHEYQHTILSDTSQEVDVIKPSQVGLTEATIRYSLAACAIMKGFTVIYTLPTAKFASRIMGTRVDPVIKDSEELKDLINKSIDNTEVKQIGRSFLYLSGSASGNAPISVPADMLIHDELDFSDQDIIEMYQSRLTHSPYKLKRRFSTPTVEGYGIHHTFTNSRRHKQFLTCSHCNHRFVPDYYEHVKIPGYDGNLDDIHTGNLHNYNWQLAQLLCPRCGKAPDVFDLTLREWVCENPTEARESTGYQVSPFCAPRIITPAYLVSTSTKLRKSQFDNFNLGIATQDGAASFSIVLLDSMIDKSIPPMTGPAFMGVDVGKTCHVTIGRLIQGKLLVVHTEQVHFTVMKQRIEQLVKEYSVKLTVIDALPYTETVLSMQQSNSNMYAAYYDSRVSTEVQRVKDQAELEKEGRLEVRQVHIQRDLALNICLEDAQAGAIRKLSDKNDDEWKNQLRQMKRIEQITSDNEIIVKWVKPASANDHFHHSLVYLQAAVRLGGLSTNQYIPSFLVTSRKIKRKS